MILDNRVVKSFVNRVREKFLNLDFDRQFDRIEASTALAGGDRGDVRGDENAVVQGFEAHVEVHLRVLGDADQGIAERFGYGNIELMLSHLAGAVHEVVHRNGERGGGEVRHNRQFYVTRAVRARSRTNRARGDQASVASTAVNASS